MNLTLKIAIIEGRRPAVDVAGEAGIHETKFSKIVNGRRQPTDVEKKAIARALKRKVTELWPEPQAKAL